MCRFQLFSCLRKRIMSNLYCNYELFILKISFYSVSCPSCSESLTWNIFTRHCQVINRFYHTSLRQWQPVFYRWPTEKHFHKYLIGSKPFSCSVIVLWKTTNRFDFYCFFLTSTLPLLESNCPKQINNRKVCWIIHDRVLPPCIYCLNIYAPIRSIRSRNLKKFRRP